MKRRLALLMLAVLPGGVSAGVSNWAGMPTKSMNAESHLLVLKNSRAVAGVLAEAGGRVVLYRRPGKPNVLKADPVFWADPASAVPQPASDAGWVEINGHINWVAPQEGWWAQQEVNPDRRGNWPPDPWMIYGRFHVLEHDASRIVLRGPVSPVTGLQLEKRFVLDPDGALHLHTTATNRRDTPVRWALWSNTRLQGDMPFVAAIDPGKPFLLETRTPEADGLAGLSFQVVDGWFSFENGARSPDARIQLAKAFFSARRGLMVAFPAPDLAFVKTFDPVAPAAVAPGQAPVEIYNRLQPEAGPTLLELEFHGAYRELDPGQVLELAETWRLEDIPPARTPADRRRAAADLAGRIDR